MHIQTREQLEQHIGSYIYHVHSLDTCSIEAWIPISLYEDNIGWWCDADPAYVEGTNSRLKIARPDTKSSYSVEADGQFHSPNYSSSRMELTKQQHFSLRDAGVTDRPTNRHKLFSTLSEAKLYCKTELGLLDRTEGFRIGEINCIVGRSGVGKSVLAEAAAVAWIDCPDVPECLLEEEAFVEPNILTMHNEGVNGMRIDPITVVEDQEPVTPPEGQIDASIPNLLVVS